MRRAPLLRKHKMDESFFSFPAQKDFFSFIKRLLKKSKRARVLENIYICLYTNKINKQHTRMARVSTTDDISGENTDGVNRVLFDILNHFEK